MLQLFPDRRAHDKWMKLCEISAMIRWLTAFSKFTVNNPYQITPFDSWQLIAVDAYQIILKFHWITWRAPQKPKGDLCRDLRDRTGITVISMENSRSVWTLSKSKKTIVSSSEQSLRLMAIDINALSKSRVYIARLTACVTCAVSSLAHSLITRWRIFSIVVRWLRDISRPCTVSWQDLAASPLT